MTDVQKEKVFDSRIIQRRPKFGVTQGAISNTNAPFNAIASTSSQMTFQIQSPSMQTFIDREIEWTTGVSVQTQVAVNTTGIAVPAGGAGTATTIPVLVFGKDVALAPFPLQSLCSTISASINDTTSTINTSDVLYEVLRLTDRKYNKLRKNTPSMLDKYQRYNDAVGAINNPLASYFDADDYDNVPNGAFWNVEFLRPSGLPLVGSGTYNVGGTDFAFVNGVPVLTSDGTNLITNYPVFFRFTATEKFVLSPFIFNEECGDRVGLFGVQNIQLVLNFQSPSRLLRNASLASGTNTRTISNTVFQSSAPFTNPKVNVMMLTPNLSVPLPPKNVVPYFEYPRYISTPNQEIAAGGSARLQSQTITLPMIPDMLLIYAKPQVYEGPNVGDFYLPIDQINVQFDNVAGILSSHSSEQLYGMSVDNGLHMDWNAWNGQGRVVNNDPSIQVSVNNANNVTLVGGFLVLKMGKDIALQAGSAPGVVGNYTLSYNVQVNNRTNAPITPSLFLVTVNSGFFESSQGQSRILKGILTEQDVISAPNASFSSADDLERMIGGGFMSKLSSALNTAKSMMSSPEGKRMGLGITGGAQSGGAACGGAMSGGMRTGGRKRGKADLNALF